MDNAGSAPGLTDAALGGALQSHLLPKLSAQGLSCLACTCSELRALVQGAPDELWQQAATSHLPAWHPTVPMSATAAQAKLRDYATRCQNLAAGKCSLRQVKIHLDGSYKYQCYFKLSPDLSTLATICSCPTDSTAQGNSMHAPRNYLLQFFDLVSSEATYIPLGVQAGDANGMHKLHWLADSDRIVLSKLSPGVSYPCDHAELEVFSQSSLQQVGKHTLPWRPQLGSVPLIGQARLCNWSPCRSRVLVLLQHGNLHSPELPSIENLEDNTSVRLASLRQDIIEAGVNAHADASVHSNRLQWAHDGKHVIGMADITTASECAAYVISWDSCTGSILQLVRWPKPGWAMQRMVGQDQGCFRVMHADSPGPDEPHDPDHCFEFGILHSNGQLEGIAPLEDWSWPACWSCQAAPDQQQVAFAAADHLHAINCPRGGSISRLMGQYARICWVSWAPDSRWLVCINESSTRLCRLHVVDSWQIALPSLISVEVDVLQQLRERCASFESATSLPAQYFISGHGSDCTWAADGSCVAILDHDITRQADKIIITLVNFLC